MNKTPNLPDFLLHDLIKRSLDEDLGGSGDVTSRAVVKAVRKAVLYFNSHRDVIFAPPAETGDPP